jgi:glycosyltransferase involved in cell wall biosynthesis
MNEKIKILLIGTNPPPIGGISISFNILLNILERKNSVHVEVIDLGILRKEKRYIYYLHRFLKGVKESDVTSLYVASTALPSIGLFVLILTKIFSKPFILRKAAGYDYLKVGYIKGKIAHYVIKNSTIFLAQTMSLVDLCKKRNIKNVRWYPTSRIINDNHDDIVKEYEGKYIYIGQVREYKGINEILSVARKLSNITVDIYGPLFNDVNIEEINKIKNIQYKGIIKQEDVAMVMKKYNILLLPTKAITEGYPGVIFEAYAAGLPVITTKCGGIPEIVDKKSGIFVEPGSINSLYEAIEEINKNNNIYYELRKGVKDKAKEYDAVKWADKFIEYCIEVKDK